MNIFYCPEAMLTEDAMLDETESQHVSKVLRKREGEELLVFDGKGSLFEARIISIGKKEVAIHVFALKQKEESENPKLHIAIAPPKNIERFEWFVEKASEIGVSEITPLLCKHSERKELRSDRIEKIILSACKQSLKLTLPKLNPLVKFDAFVNAVNSGNRKYIAVCDESAIHLKDAYHGGFDAVVLIGPEGDFLNEEILLADKNEFEKVSLGKSRLRLETAGIFAAAVFNLANEK